MTALPQRNQPARSPAVPPLASGDHLTRAEFERRYEATPDLRKAQLIEGIVYMPSPVSRRHGRPHAILVGWAMVYGSATRGVDYGSDVTVRLDGANEVQPDVYLRVAPDYGGQSKTTAQGYVEGAPELVIEVAATTASIDLHKKLRAYERNGVREYIVWRTLDGAIDWLVLRNDALQPMDPDKTGVHKSDAFPGLWLDAAALLRDDMPRVLAVLQEGLASPEHARFVADLAARGPRP